MKCLFAGLLINFALGLPCFADHHEETLEKMLQEIAKAVKAGELSAEEARDKIDYLKRERHSKDKDKEKLHHQIKTGLGAAVTLGSINHEEAEELFHNLTRSNHPREHDHEDSHHRKMQHRHHRFEEVVKGIQAAVQLGNLSEEEAREMIEEGRKTMEERILLEQVERGIDAAVDLGIMSESEAKEKWGALFGLDEEDEGSEETKPLFSF